MDEQLQIIQNPEQTYTTIRQSIVQAQHRLTAAVNSAMVTAYWEIGEQIFKACGENDRAGYGKKLLQYLSEQLTAEFGKGFSVQGLRNMRQFYCTFPIRSTLWSELSWSHYRILMRIPNEKERAFYTEECAKSAWSVRQLERQIHTMYYQRLLSSQDKAPVATEIQTTEPKPEYEKIVKDPYVMEFLQIKPDTHVFESDLEQALINHLQQFLLELGRGFSFVARQKRFALDGQNGINGQSMLVDGTNAFHLIVIIACYCAGAALVMWLAEKINESGIGNGISMILFAGIVSRGPALVSSLWYMMFKDGKFSIIGLLLAILFHLLLVPQKLLARLSLH